MSPLIFGVLKFCVTVAISVAIMFFLERRKPRARAFERGDFIVVVGPDGVEIKCTVAGFENGRLTLTKVDPEAREWLGEQL